MASNVFKGMLAFCATGLVACGGHDGEVTSQRASAVSWPVVIAYVETATGSAVLKRDGAPTYAPAWAGQILFRGDLLRASGNGRLEIRCASDETSWRIPADGLPHGAANYCW